MSGTSAVEFYTAEANRIHELLDAALVTRTAPDGSVLSLSQRVEQLAGLFRYYATQYLKSL